MTLCLNWICSCSGWWYLERERQGGREANINNKKKKNHNNNEDGTFWFLSKRVLKSNSFLPLFKSLVSVSFLFAIRCCAKDIINGLARLEDADVLDCISSSCCLSAFAYELNSADRIGSCFENQSKCQSRILFSFNKTRISGSFHSTNA